MKEIKNWLNNVSWSDVAKYTALGVGLGAAGGLGGAAVYAYWVSTSTQSIITVLMCEVFKNVSVTAGGVGVAGAGAGMMLGGKKGEKDKKIAQREAAQLPHYESEDEREELKHHSIKKRVLGAKASEEHAIA